MAQRCQNCRFYCGNPLSTSICPECGGRLVVSFLPPAGEQSSLLPGVPVSRTARLGDASGWWGFPHSNLFDWQRPNGGLIPLVLLISLSFAIYVFWSWNQRAELLHERAIHLTVGMTVGEAFLVMGDVPPTRLDEPAEIIWEGGDQAVCVRFVNGVVEDIRHQPARGGFQARHISRQSPSYRLTDRIR